MNLERQSAVDRSLVAGLPLFVGLTEDEIDDILSDATAIRYPKSHRIFEQGAEAHSFFVLLHGHVRAEKTTPHGDQIVMRYVSPGETFGIAQALNLTHYPATAVAVVDCVVVAWPNSAWHRLIAKCPQVALNTLQIVGGRLQDAQAQVMEISTLPVERRVAHALVRLVRQAGRQVAAGVEIDFPISRRDIAEMTGTTLHTVSRILSSWEQQGWIESTGRQRITVRSRQKLVEIAQADDN